MKALQRAAGLGRSPANARRLVKAYENALNGVHVAEHDLVDPDAADPGSDNEPKVMLCYVAEALDAVEPVGAGVRRARLPGELGTSVPPIAGTRFRSPGPEADHFTRTG